MSTGTISPRRPLVLASASPRRADLLRQTMIPFRILPSRADEHEESISPVELALELALKKADEVRTRVENRWILAADTVVVAGEEILGKPAGKSDAERMLRTLSDREHLVITGFVLTDPAGKTAHREAPATRVRVKRLSEDEIAGYIATGEPFGKAGGYAVQGIGTFMVERIEGSYTNVVGLPLFEVLKALVKTGAVEKFPF